MYPKFDSESWCDICNVQRKGCSCFVRTPVEELEDIRERIDKLLKRMKREEKENV